jgi:hypothetical protein
VAVLGLLQLEPLKAALAVVCLLLLRQQQRHAEAICQRSPAGISGEVGCVLAAAMQQDEQRRTFTHGHLRQIDAQT